MKLERKKKYLQIALNSNLEQAAEIIRQIPFSDKILIEVGTPLLKSCGAAKAIATVRSLLPPQSYVVADTKCADLADRETEIAAAQRGIPMASFSPAFNKFSLFQIIETSLNKQRLLSGSRSPFPLASEARGADAATVLGVAPLETIDLFIEECKKRGLDSMVDMMNVQDPLAVLKKLKNIPDIVVLHRGVDESEFSKEKQIPYYQIKQIKGNYKSLVAVAGGDTIREVQRAFFNDADIVVVWKNFYQATSDTAKLARDFLREVK